ncbi:Fpg/Nei family DNA glycosylase [Alienimonas californiensis]|uniref:DNA-(apurinic or apyrimidinic site) lyase n=1 Tax=Alienimonas californiensis TaxID=2527989 RepID=A0A517PAA6_9PLAN|nr:DNA-formamidopyrimidine glycosylase family protein [Alienimonas californiensis]QDT16306.1 Endonuclease 8 1 [Alienimonas californiensis]
MPEGHKVHHLAAQHRAAFAGADYAVSSPQGRFRTGAAELDGLRLVDVSAHGKHLFYEFGGEDEPGSSSFLHVHLGRYGKFAPLTRPVPEPVGAVRVRLVRTDDGAGRLPPTPGAQDPGPVVGFDLRGPTACETLAPHEVEAIHDRLGPDPLAPRRGDEARVRAAFAKSKKPAGALIMDQPVVSGVGNIFRAEAFYELRMDPARPANSLSDEEFAALWRTIKRQMKTGLEYGKIVTRTAREAGKSRAELTGMDRFRIYRQPRCPRCGDETHVWELGGRTMYACRRCQGVAG